MQEHLYWVQEVILVPLTECQHYLTKGGVSMWVEQGLEVMGSQNNPLSSSPQQTTTHPNFSLTLCFSKTSCFRTNLSFPVTPRAGYIFYGDQLPTPLYTGFPQHQLLHPVLVFPSSQRVLPYFRTALASSVCMKEYLTHFLPVVSMEITHLPNTLRY